MHADSREIEIAEILKESHVDRPVSEKKVRADQRLHSSSEEVSIAAAIDLVIDRQRADEAEDSTALVSGIVEVNRDEIEKEIASLPLNAFETEISNAIGDSRSGYLLRQLVFGKRYEKQIPLAARLEDTWINELAVDTDAATRAMADALARLPKTGFREEHVRLWEIANRLPEGHDRLQLLSPDEEFK